jgi:hypothetical protein
MMVRADDHRELRGRIGIHASTSDTRTCEPNVCRPSA